MALRCRPPMLGCSDRSAARVPPKVAESIYTTPEFKDWALKVKKRAGFRCEAPGCGRVGVRMFADHIVEVKDGGAKFDLRNGQCLCGSCHTTKTAAERSRRLSAPDAGISDAGREGV